MVSLVGRRTGHRGIRHDNLQEEDPDLRLAWEVVNDNGHSPHTGGDEEAEFGGDNWAAGCTHAEVAGRGHSMDLKDKAAEKVET